MNFIDDKVVEFYRQLASSLGLSGQSTHTSVVPFAANGDFNVSQAAPGSVDKYFDIGNVAAGNIDSAAIGGYSGRTLFVGNLFLSTYAVGIGGGAVMTFNQFLSTGPSANLTNWMFRKRTAVASDDQPNFNAYDGTAAPPIVKSGFSDNYLGVCFSFLRITQSQTGAGTVGVTCEFLFNGVRIDC